MRVRRNPEVPKWLIAIGGLAAVGGIWWWWSRRYAAFQVQAARQALALATKQAIISAVPLHFSAVTPGQAAAMSAANLPKDPRTWTPQQTARAVEITETYANTGAGHF